MASSLNFDGSDDYIDLGNLTILDNSTEFTFMSYGKIDVVGGNDSIFSSQISSLAASEGCLFCMNRSGPLMFLGLESSFGTASFIKTSGLTGSTGNWYHWTWTWNASISAQLLGGSKFYQDGNSVSLIDHFQGTGTTNNFTPTTGDYNIGRRYDKSDTWDGNLAYLRVYNRALSQEEIQESIKNPEAIVNGLVGYWPLWTTGAKDLSGNGNDGTIVGTVTASDSGPPVYFPDLQTN